MLKNLETIKAKNFINENLRNLQEDQIVKESEIPQGNLNLLLNFLLNFLLIFLLLNKLILLKVKIRKRKI
jgi:hypothetical protein